MNQARLLTAHMAVRRADRRPPKPRRPLTLADHFWFTALLTAVVMVAPIALSVHGC